MSAGQRDYEADVAERPLYHDGTPRKTWDQLGEIEKESWNLGVKVAWRVFINGKYSHVAYGVTGEDAIQQENARQSTLRLPTLEIRVSRVSSASDRGHHGT